ncbi:MAG: hypothetical protein R3217_09570 [Gammaproteobacteria bacterium]|nr:hypothetical protein [Gammaproteobacteria bacterium]
MRYLIAATIAFVMGSGPAVAMEQDSEASEPDFGRRYVELQLHKNRFAGQPGDGRQVEASFPILSDFFIIGIYSKDSTEEGEDVPFIGYFSDNYATDPSFDNLNGGTRREDVLLGIGRTWSGGDESIEFMARVMFARSRFSYAWSGNKSWPRWESPDDGDTGIVWALGMRTKVSSAFEIYGEMERNHLRYLDNLETEWREDFGKLSLEIGGQYRVANSVKLSLGYVMQGDVQRLQLGLRYGY